MFGPELYVVWEGGKNHGKWAAYSPKEAIRHARMLLLAKGEKIGDYGWHAERKAGK
jgi:hypothetical protein